MKGKETTLQVTCAECQRKWDIEGLIHKSVFHEQFIPNEHNDVYCDRCGTDCR